MKWENINLTKNQISYVRHKTRKKTNGLVITLPIHPVLHDALLMALEWKQSNSPYILPNVARRYQTNRSGVQRDVMKIIRCALNVETTTHDYDGCKRACGANVYSLHSFRHAFVSFCANAGVPEAVVAAIVGHGSPVMTRHYTHIADSAKQEAINVLPMLSSSAPNADTEPPRSEDTVGLRQRLRDFIQTATPEQLQGIAGSLPIHEPRLLA